MIDNEDREDTASVRSRSPSPAEARAVLAENRRLNSDERFRGREEQRRNGNQEIPVVDLEGEEPRLGNMQIIQAFNDQAVVIKNLAEQIQSGVQKGRKRRSEESGYSSDEEELTIRTGSYRDDGEKTVDTKARKELSRRPNIHPKEYWNSELCEPTTPRLGESIPLEYMMVNKVNHNTLLAAHDPMKDPELKAYAPGNAGYGRKQQKIFKLSQTKGSGVELKSGAEMKDIDGVYATVDTMWSKTMAKNHIM